MKIKSMMKHPLPNVDTQENDYKTKNENFVYFKPHPSGEVWRGLQILSYETECA
jgi:hypothetical protein